MTPQDEPAKCLEIARGRVDTRPRVDECPREFGNATTKVAEACQKGVDARKRKEEIKKYFRLEPRSMERGDQVSP